ncbi:MAG: replicative DNA helicase [Caudoviricetes sp.]|nr:MAG: replicative DNA helicase [Caudoviricetes sp.]
MVKMTSKYVDISSIVQVIGSIYNNPKILDNDYKYHFNEEDFPDQFHKVLFSSIYDLHALGANEISINNIEDYLEKKPKRLGIYKNNRGAEYLQQISETTQLAAFDYYYQRMKKMTLFRCYEEAGMDLSWLYDPDNILDSKKKQKQEEWLDNTPIEDIADIIDKKISKIRDRYVNNSDERAITKAGSGALDLVRRLRDTPEIGYPLYGAIINRIHRGGRFKKFYLRSGSTGAGKTRTMIADTCYIGCDEIYDENERKWIKNGTKEPVMYNTTEQDLEEVQTMMIAFLSAVDEEHILNGEYLPGEWERVEYASKLLSESPIYVKELPDFSLQDIENVIKFGINEYGVRYIVHDYIHSSLKILSEVSSKTKVQNLREDNILFMISVKIKDICNKYGVFILSGTQLNGSYKDTKVYDQNLLRGKICALIYLILLTNKGTLLVC